MNSFSLCHIIGKDQEKLMYFHTGDFKLSLIIALHSAHHIYFRNVYLL